MQFAVEIKNYSNFLPILYTTGYLKIEILAYLVTKYNKIKLIIPKSRHKHTTAVFQNKNRPIFKLFTGQKRMKLFKFTCRQGALIVTINIRFSAQIVHSMNAHMLNYTQTKNLQNLKEFDFWRSDLSKVCFHVNK